MANKLAIWQDMTPGVSKQFRLVETFPTIDGYRTRITCQCFDTLVDALNAFDMANKLESKTITTEATIQQIAHEVERLRATLCSLSSVDFAPTLDTRKVGIDERKYEALQEFIKTTITVVDDWKNGKLKNGN